MAEKIRQPLQPNTVAILGIPFDECSSFRKGAANAPTYIREKFYSESGNLCTEKGIDLAAAELFKDLGDLEIPDAATESTFQHIREALGNLLAKDVRTIVLGGDHSITYPVIKAYAEKYPSLNLLHFDAHPDLYDEFNDNRLSHACSFARIMEEGLVQRLVQVGIRTLNPPQRTQAERFGVEVVDMQRWNPRQSFRFEGPLYLSLDLDVLDPAFAPGVSHPEPGGLSTREVLQLIHRLKKPLVGADIVELNPTLDLAGTTALAAGKFLKELAGMMLAGHPPDK